MKTTGSVVPVLCAVGLVFAWSTAASPDDEAVPAVRATAQIKGCTDPNITGRAFLVERPSAEGVKLVDVRVVVKGLPPGQHAVHIHENGSCTPCGDAKGHFDPGPSHNSTPVEANHPYHSGDLINLTVDEDGVGVLQTTTSRITLSPGPLTVFHHDVVDGMMLNGAAIIVHEKADTYCPDTAKPTGCAGGARQACGVIEPAPSAPEEDEDADGESE